MSKKMISGQFSAMRIELDDSGKFCSPTCPQMKDGLCDKFGRTLEEREKAKEFHPFSPQYEDCKLGTKLFSQIFGMISEARNELEAEKLDGA